MRTSSIGLLRRVLLHLGRVGAVAVLGALLPKMLLSLNDTNALISFIGVRKKCPIALTSKIGCVSYSLVFISCNFKKILWDRG